MHDTSSPAHTPAAFSRNAEAPVAGRFMSKEECAALAKQIVGFARGGITTVTIESSWTGNIAWARNQIQSCGDVRNNDIGINRTVRGATNQVSINQLDASSCEAAVRRAERLLIQQNESLDVAVAPPYTEPYDSPKLWFDSTYQLDAAARAAAMRALVKPAEEAGMSSAGYIEVSAHGRAVINTTGTAVYYPYTLAQYSVTVRDPGGTASGWAGVDFNDWSRIDATALSAIALQKCLSSRNAAAIEPGRYTTILEPQAVADIVSVIFEPGNAIMDRFSAEDRRPQRPFSGPKRFTTKIGTRIIDKRISITADPMDPDCGFLPYGVSYWSNTLPVYHPVKWVDQGVLAQLQYSRDPYGIQHMGVNTGLLNSGAFHMSGGTTSVEEMIATTQRGLLVTRFSGVELIEDLSVMTTGYTRDGVWLIENGKISKPAKNFRFTESPLLMLNNVLQLGVPKRVFHPSYPIVVPALKVEDFSFTSLSDAI